jgi:hypothetical protein
VKDPHGREEIHHYEILLEINGVKVGERVFPAPIEGKGFKQGLPRTSDEKKRELLAAFVPDHLPLVPVPKSIVKAKRLILKADEVKRPTTIFAPDNRRIFRNTAYPSPEARCLVSLTATTTTGKCLACASVLSSETAYQRNSTPRVRWLLKENEPRPTGAQTGARAQKVLQIVMLVIVSKTVSGFWVRRGFKSLPLRSIEKPHGYAVSQHLV